jgi:hypothetical protein
MVTEKAVHTVLSQACGYRTDLLEKRGRNDAGRSGAIKGKSSWVQCCHCDRLSGVLSKVRILPDEQMGNQASVRCT